MRAHLCWVITITTLFLMAKSALAHHAFAAEFDARKPVTLKGTVAKMEWVNPHAWIHIDVKTEEGKVERWEIETGNPNALIRRGFTKNSLPSGTEVTVSGYRAKDGTMRASGYELMLKDGKRLFVGSSGTGAPYERPDR